MSVNNNRPMVHMPTGAEAPPINLEEATAHRNECLGRIRAIEASIAQQRVDRGRGNEPAETREVNGHRLRLLQDQLDAARAEFFTWNQLRLRLQGR